MKGHRESKRAQNRAQKVWALPFLTALAPSERYNQQHQRRHKKLTDWARQMMSQVKRWLPTRELVVVADSSFAALELLAGVSKRSLPIHMITRLRLDAAIYEGRITKTARYNGTTSRLLEKGCQTWKKFYLTQIPNGKKSRSSVGMERENAQLKSVPE